MSTEWPDRVADSIKPELIITEWDLPDDAKSSLSALAADTRMLASSEDAKKILFDALPTAVARRLKEIVPNGFAIAELEMVLSLDGKIFGVGLGGQVKVKFAPAPGS